MSRLYARALKGERAVGERPDGRGKNLTLVGAMALRGMVAAMTFFGGCDRYAFQTFVEKILIPNLWTGAVVVMDNFSSHQVAGIRTAIEAAGARLVYLSPYSPDFSRLSWVGRKSRNSLEPKRLVVTQLWMKPSPQRLMRSPFKIFSIGFATVVTVFHPTENRYIATALAVAIYQVLLIAHNCHAVKTRVSGIYIMGDWTND
jgi:transposase